MSQHEFKSELLRGKPIEVEFLKLKPLTLKEIFDFGEPNYQKVLSMFFFDVGEVDFGSKPELENISKFVLLCLILQQEKQFRMLIEEGLQLFSGLNFEFCDGLFIYNNKYVINEKIWEQIKEVLAIQNKIKYEPESLKYNPIGARAKAMQKKIEETRKQVKELKDKDKSKPDITDLISGLCAKHPSINLINVWDLTYYQFVDQLERLQIVEEYEFALQSILAGADSKKMKIKHWTTKI